MHNGTQPNIEWNLKVPAVEVVSSTFQSKFDDLEREIKISNAKPEKSNGPSTRFPDSFMLMSIQSNKKSLSDPVELTTGNLDELWQDDRTEPSIEILFLTNENKEDKPRERLLSVKWMAENLGVSPCFFDGVFHSTESAVLELPPLPTSELRTERTTLDDNLNGVYITSHAATWTTVWFSHQLDGMMSLYVIHGAGKSFLGNLSRCIAQGLYIPFLGIDTLLLNDERLFNLDYREAYEHAHKALEGMNSPSSRFEVHAMLKPSQGGQSEVINRYTAVYNIQRAYTNKRRAIELLKRLVSTRERLMEGKGFRFHCYRGYSGGAWKSDLSRTRALLHTVEGTLSHRQEIIKDSLDLLRTLMNVRLAMYSAEMAKEAKKDSSSMTTVSLLTMLFLPGSFVSSFFSMSLVKIGESDQATSLTNSMAEQVKLVAGSWVFFVISACLTLAVFAIWIYYHGRHYHSMPSQLRLRQKKVTPSMYSPV